MIYYFLWPVFSVAVIVLQNAAADIIFSGRLLLEISLIFVVYAGFRFDLFKGSFASLTMGLVFDCIYGLNLGLFTLIYTLVFLFSFFTAARLVIEKMKFLVLFTFLCALIEELMVLLFYNLVYGFDVLNDSSFIFLLQALIIGLLAPVFFYVMRKIEVFFYGQPAQSAERTGTDRISAET